MADTQSRKKQRRDPRARHDPDPDEASERACDARRTRRVRCDKSAPCNNCRRRGDGCHTTAAPSSVPRPRSSITKGHERRFDSMADQLANIEQFLRQQQRALAPLTQAHLPTHDGFHGTREPPLQATTGLPSPQSLPPQDQSDATTETHSTVARQLVEKAVEGSPAVCQDSELVDALHSLKDMAVKIEDGLAPNVSRPGQGGSANFRRDSTTSTGCGRQHHAWIHTRTECCGAAPEMRQRV